MASQPRQIGSDGRFMDLPVNFHDGPPGSCSPEWLRDAIKAFRPTVSIPRETGDALMRASNAANNLSVIDGTGGIYTPAATIWSGTQSGTMGTGDTTLQLSFSGFGGTGLDPTNDSTVCVFNVVDSPGSHLANWSYTASAGVVTLSLFRVANDTPSGPFAAITITATLKLFQFPAPNVIIP